MRYITRRDKEKDSLSDLILKLAHYKREISDFLNLDPDEYSKKQIRKTLHYLKEKEFIAFPAYAKAGRITLTTLGIRRLNQLKFERLRIDKIRWDGKWRLLMFDIPEKLRGLRHTFRRKLKQLGFYHFQRSVFILPYECKKEIDLLTDYLQITPFVHLLTADRFLGDKQLIGKFNLKIPQN